MDLTMDQMQKDIDFLLVRANGANKIAFKEEDRDTGISSNSLVMLAYSPYPKINLSDLAMPMDKWDLAACERAFEKLPEHRKTNIVMEGLEKQRANLK